MYRLCIIFRIGSGWAIFQFFWSARPLGNFSTRKNEYLKLKKINGVKTVLNRKICTKDYYMRICSGKYRLGNNLWTWKCIFFLNFHKKTCIFAQIKSKLALDREIRFTYHPNLFAFALIMYTEGYYIKKNINPFYLKSIFRLGWTGAAFHKKHKLWIIIYDTFYEPHITPLPHITPQSKFEKWPK